MDGATASWVQISRLASEGCTWLVLDRLNSDLTPLNWGLALPSRMQTGLPRVIEGATYGVCVTRTVAVGMISWRRSQVCSCRPMSSFESISYLRGQGRACQRKKFGSRDNNRR